MRRTTIKDVAKAAGVSTASVSQALRPREGSNIKLQESKIELIRATAKKLNYRPHSGARSIRSRRFGSVGYFSPKAQSLVIKPHGYQHGVHDALEEAGYRITLIRVSPRLATAREQIPNAFAEMNLDALIFESYNELAGEIYDLYRDQQFPFLYLNDKHAWNSVFVDDAKGASLLTEHAITRGYRNICFVHRHILGEVSIEKMHHSATDRAMGYTQTMTEHGLEPAVEIVHCSSVLSGDVEITDEQWATLAGYDALIAYDDDLANTIARKAYETGVRIPDDIGLAGFNGDYASLSAWRPLTTMMIPTYDMGLAIGQMAAQSLQETKPRPIPSRQFVPTLVEGRTL